MITSSVRAATHPACGNSSFHLVAFVVFGHLQHIFLISLLSCRYLNDCASEAVQLQLDIKIDPICLLHDLNAMKFTCDTDQSQGPFIYTRFHFPALVLSS